MIDQHFQIVRLDERMLGRVTEKIVGMPHDELIQRGGRGHQYGARAAAAPTRATGALPGGGNCSGIASHDDASSEPTSMPSSSRRSGDHAADFAVTQAAFNFAALAWANIRRDSRECSLACRVGGLACCR